MYKGGKDDKCPLNLGPRKKKSKRYWRKSQIARLCPRASDLLPARRFSFDPYKEVWLCANTLVHIASEEFTHGGMRACYKAVVLDDGETDTSGFCDDRGYFDGYVSLYVAKRYKKYKDASMKKQMRKTSYQTYFDELLTQCVAEQYAQQFNKEKIDIPVEFTRAYPDYPESFEISVAFLPVSVIQLNGVMKTLYNIEPFIPGHYEKFNDNFGWKKTKDQDEETLDPKKRRRRVLSRTRSDLAQTFSHYTYCSSSGLNIVVDIQGVGSYYTDPQIHTFDGVGFGMGNLGQRGIYAFTDSHICNYI